MFILLQVLQGILGIISLVCFILVLVRMFQENQTGLGVACIILLFCFGIGALIAFIVGWVNARRWGINNIMTIWTACVVVGIILSIIGFATGAVLWPGR
jgi:hypothetical protein